MHTDLVNGSAHELRSAMVYVMHIIVILIFLDVIYRATPGSLYVSLSSILA